MTLKELKEYCDNLVREGWSWTDAYRMLYQKIEKLVKELDKDLKK